MKQTTLSFLLKDDQVLLAIKKRGFGAGKWNGVGGKLKTGEGFEDAAIREVWEEINVRVAPADLEFAGMLEFEYRDNPDWHQRCHLFRIAKWQGEPAESEEMRPQWHPIEKLPFGEMWIDDPCWLPLVLAGKKIDGRFLFDRTGEIVLDYSVKEI
jgi:8-oxo-dGTP pyrophosphatase MutT (NUDIX family)